MTLTPARIKAQKKWRAKNQGINSVGIKKSVAFQFVKYLSNFEDLKTLENDIKKRRSYLTDIQPTIKAINKIFQSLKNENYFDNYFIALKSSMILEKNFQEFWEQLKKIKGDPLLIVVNEELFNLFNEKDLAHFETLFLIPQKNCEKLEKLQNTLITNFKNF